MAPASKPAWLSALPWALPILATILAGMYYGFAVADRYIVFLYYHEMGPFVPDTSPFSQVTASRYWMSGLVICGAVLLAYTAVHWLLGRMRAAYQPPGWQWVWALCAAPLALAIPAITMTVNSPTLPLGNALQVTLATLAGLAIALLPASLAARQPVRLLWLAADGWGLTWVVYGLTALQFLPRWLRVGGTRWIVGWMATLVLGLVWLCVMSGLRLWCRKQVPSIGEVLLAAAAIAYLLMPLVHYVSFTDGYYYISNGDNFFAQQAWFQIVVWLLGGALVAGLTRLRESLQDRINDPRQV